MIHSITISSVLILDYILTFIGLDLGIIREGNFFLLWLFELPFILALSLRIIMALGLIKLFNHYKKRPNRDYRTALTAFYSIYSIVMALHFTWILQYFSIQA